MNVAAGLTADRAVTDILAELQAIPMNLRCSLVGGLLGQLDVLAQRSDAQYAAAGRDDLAILVGRAGVEDVAVLAKAVALGQADDDIALLRGIRVVGSGKHHAECDAAIPFGFDLVERTVDAV